MFKQAFSTQGYARSEVLLQSNRVLPDYARQGVFMEYIMNNAIDFAQLEAMAEKDFFERLDAFKERLAVSQADYISSLNTLAPSAILAARCNGKLARLNSLAQAIPAKFFEEFRKHVLIACGGFYDSDKARVYAPQNSLLLWSNKAREFIINSAASRAVKKQAREAAERVRYIPFMELSARAPKAKPEPLGLAELKRLCTVYEKRGARADVASTFANIYREAMTYLESIA